jgi:eukaryotic-like serine/threonine-protein kinase
MAAATHLVGQFLGHYRILEQIGSGGMGVVYRAHDEQLERDVAVKVLPAGTLADEAARRRFRKEALALAKLNHPNIATIHNFDIQQGVDFLVMEYIAGVTLSEKLSSGPLGEKQAAELGGQLAEGLAAAHEHGVVHCDLKPGNLRVTVEGGLKILDFGLAKLPRPVTGTAVTDSVSRTEGIVGTLPYMAPEQFLGEVIDSRTDIHAAGALLYEMSTGKRPFAEVERSQLIAAILRRPPLPPTDLNPRISVEMARIIEKCLEKDPKNRSQSAQELVVDLRRLCQPQSTRVKAASKRPLRTVRLTAAGLLVAVALISAFWGWQHHSIIQPPRTGKIMLAVLPFENHSGDPAQDYFGEGLTEEMVTRMQTRRLHRLDRSCEWITFCRAA